MQGATQGLSHMRSCSRMSMRSAAGSDALAGRVHSFARGRLIAACCGSLGTWASSQPFQCVGRTQANAGRGVWCDRRVRLTAEAITRERCASNRNGQIVQRVRLKECKWRRGCVLRGVRRWPGACSVADVARDVGVHVCVCAERPWGCSRGSNFVWRSGVVVCGLQEVGALLTGVCDGIQ